MAGLVAKVSVVVVLGIDPFRDPQYQIVYEQMTSAVFDQQNMHISSRF